jgi:DNA-binding NtrC family response regulator
MGTNAGPRSRLLLDVYTGGTVSTHPLPESGQVTIGRAEDNDVRIDHASVSRKHVVLHLGPPLRLWDLGGPNGTSVRAPDEPARENETARVRRVSGETVEILVGACITVGTVMILVREATPEPAARADQAFVLHDPAMLDLYEQAYLAAAAPISVLLLGETGVGKEVLAQAIHRKSPRAPRPFLALHCASLAESLLESELFGHEKNAFTGALTARPGLFESASGGTVFLDEVGELPMTIQVKLLRLLETREVLRIGARTTTQVDVRFISATHRDLEAAVAAGSFRADLYFRLNGIALTIPPLRERPSEIAPLVERFVAQSCRELDRSPAPRVSPELAAQLARYPWPGNVRELRQAVARAVVLCTGDTLRPEHLPAKISAWTPETGPKIEPRPAPAAPGDEVIDRLRSEVAAREQRRVLEALEQCQGNQTRAAELLGISRRTLVTRLGEYGLTRPRRKP